MPDGMNTPERPRIPSSPDEDIRNQIERTRSFYERSPESPIEDISETTLPWIVRIAVRDTLFDGFIDPPAGLGDNWGLQRIYSKLGERSKKLTRVNYSSEARTALGFGKEPWRDVSIIPRQHQQEFLEIAITKNELGGMGLEPTKARLVLVQLEKDAKERIPRLASELLRSRDELSTVRRLIYMWWAWRNAASGQEVGQDYLDSKIPVIPRYDDFQKVFSLPATFMTQEEIGNVAGYPEPTEVKAIVQAENLTKEQGSFGELVQKEVRLMNLVALSDQPEEIMKWKLQAETKKLYGILEAKGINGIYLFLKRKGIEYNDVEEEAKIANAISSLTEEEKESVKNAFWEQFGYTDAGAAKEMVGDPEMWIPLKARRGEPSSGDSTPFLEPDGRNKTEVYRQKRVDEAKKVLEELKKDWQSLSPLLNLSQTEQLNIRNNIYKLTNQFRELSTSYVLSDDGKKYELTTVLPSLQLENELGLRGKATRQGCIWARPQMAKDKVSVMEGAFMDFVGGNNLAFEEAQAVVGLMGIPAKWGYYARDFDPTIRAQQKFEGPGYLPGEWQVDVEAWPYTSEYQNILAWPWHQQYKAEAGGPDGSRGKFGSLMTDYLSAYTVEQYDANNNRLYVIINKDGNLKYGRPDEGVIIIDTAVTLMDYWHSGGSLANLEPWEKIIEDPYRRFKLRGFFASGKTVFGPGGNELLGLWKRRDWKLDDLDTDKFWDDYKLARKVALREELFEEDVWREVVAPIDKKYKEDASACITKIKAAGSEEARKTEMKNYRKLYRKWRVGRRKAVFDYSDKTFGEGLLSTQMIEQAKLAQAFQIGETRLDKPRVVLERISKRAQSRSVNLGWDLKQVFSLFKL